MSKLQRSDFGGRLLSYDVSDTWRTPLADTGSLRVNNLTLNKNSRTAARNGLDIQLTSAEFDLLWYLAAHAGQIVSREELYRQILKTEYDGQNRAINLRVSRLRRKLNVNDGQRRLIKSIRFEGYCMAAAGGNEGDQFREE